MTTVVNDRDIALLGVSPRLIATTVTITAPSAGFTRAKNGGAITPTSITLTANTNPSSFTSAAPSFVWEYSISSVPDTWTPISGSSDTQVIAATDSYISALLEGEHVRFRVTATKVGYTTANNFDSLFVITYFKEPDDIVVLNITKVASIVLAAGTGVVTGTPPNTGTTITAKRGTLDLTYGASGANTYSVGTPTVTPTGAVTLGTNTSGVFADITAMATAEDYALVSYPVTYRDALGNHPVTASVVQTFTKIKDNSSFQIYIFTRSATQPVTPTSDDPTTDDPIIWYDAPPAANGTPLWTTIAKKNAAGGLIETWSVPVQIEGGALVVEYSVDGTGGWVSTFVAGTHFYAQYSYDNGATWIGPVKIAGEDGITHRLTRDSVLLPVYPNGEISSWATATTTFYVEQGPTDISSSWTFSKEDFDVTSTLVANALTVTSFGSLYGVTWSADIGYTLPSGGHTSSYSNMSYGNGAYIKPCLGSTSKMLRSTNEGASWAEVTMPATAEWARAVWNGSFWLATASSNSTSANGAYSSDNGATWSASTLPSSAYWYMVAGGNNRTIIAWYTASNAYYTDNGTSWTSVSLPSSKDWRMAAYGNGIWLMIAYNSNTPAISSNNGATWSNASALPFSNPNQITFADGMFICKPATSNVLARSTDGVTWYTTTIPAAGYYYPQYNVTYDKWLLIDYLTGDIAVSADAIDWSVAANTGTKLPGVMAVGSTTGDIVVASTSLPKVKTVEIATNVLPTSGYVNITASKDGFVSVVKRFDINTGINSDLISAYVFPSSFSIPSASDGVVAADGYTGASAVVTVLVNGVDDTANWTITTTPSTGVTISGDDTASFAVTNMTSAVDSGYIDIVASKANYNNETMRYSISKAKSGTPSGMLMGANYGAINVTGQYIAIRFLRNGGTEVKRTAAGSWISIGAWFGLISATAGDAYYLKIVNSGDAFTSGAAVGSYLQLNTDREFIFESAVAGTYVMDLKVYIATSNTGADAVIGFGLLELEVPAITLTGANSTQTNTSGTGVVS